MRSISDASLDRLLTLTADIAEALLDLRQEKGEGKKLTDELLDKIQELASIGAGSEPAKSLDVSKKVQIDEEAPASSQERQEENKTLKRAEIPSTKSTLEDVPLRSLFSVNDIFLFRREIFSGDDKAFNQALIKIGNMSTLEQVRDYLLQELRLDPKSEVTKSLFNQISTLFQQ